MIRSLASLLKHGQRNEQLNEMLRIAFLRNLQVIGATSELSDNLNAESTKNCCLFKKDVDLKI